MKLVFSLALCAYVLTTSCARAEFAYLSGKQALGLIRAVTLHVQDNVKEGCWTNVSLVKNKMRLLFERNSIPVTDQIIGSLFNPSIIIRASGERVKQQGITGCVGYVSILIYFPTSKIFSLEKIGSEYEVGGVFMMDEIIVYLAGPNFNDLILDWSDGQLSGIIADIMSMRRDPNVIQFLADWAQAYEQK